MLIKKSCSAHINIFPSLQHKIALLISILQDMYNICFTGEAFVLFGFFYSQ